MEIKPFKALRFDESVVGNCVAPPYDVIKPDQQQKLYEKSEYNIVRIIKGKTFDSDNKNDNQYTRAARYLNDWIDKGALKPDPAEAIYAYVQDFDLAGENVQRLTFIALARLEEFGKIVRPHEQTLKKPTIDRLNLIRAAKAKFGLVFTLYEDPQNIADKIIEQSINQKPLIDFIDDQGVRHRLFAIVDKNNIDAIVKMMSDKSILIADGHHRYGTGLMYSKENPNAKFQMLAFSNTRHEGLLVLATHRIVDNLENFDITGMITALKENFDVTEYSFDSEQTKIAARSKMLFEMKLACEKGKNAFGIYAADGSFYLAELKNPKAMDSAAPQMSPPWRTLDVAVLHKLILENILGIDEKKLADQSNLEYVKDTPTAIDDSIRNIDTGKKQLAFFMNPPKIEQLLMVADHGEKMPQKSTYFYPKVFTGLTINKL